jgi:hypothetical protein
LSGTCRYWVATHWDLPLEPGDICSMTVILPLDKQVSVSAGIVRWVRGEDFGVETLVINGKAQAQLSQYIRERIKNL